MTSTHGIADLRADIPALEPDAVLLAQLVQLSAAGAASATTSRGSSAKVLAVAAGVAVAAGTTWVAAAVPGIPLPSLPGHHHPHPVVRPSAPPSRGGAPTPTPGASGSTPAAPGSVEPTPDGQRPGDVPRATPTIQQLGTRGPSGHPGSGGLATPTRPPHSTLWQEWKTQHGADSHGSAQASGQQHPGQQGPTAHGSPQQGSAHVAAQTGSGKHGSGSPPESGGAPGGREASPQ